MAAVVDSSPTILYPQHRVDYECYQSYRTINLIQVALPISPVFVTVHHSDLMQIAGTQSSTTHTPRDVYKARRKETKFIQIVAVLLNVGAVSLRD